MLVQFLPAREAKATLAEHFSEMLFCTHPVVQEAQIGMIFFFSWVQSEFYFTLTGMETM